MSFLLFLLPLISPAPRAVAVEVRVVLGVAADGRPTEGWLEVIRQRRDAATLRELAGNAAELTAEEEAWLELVQARRSLWQKRVPALRVPFPDVEPPAEVVVLVGNQGGEDAFVYAPTTICFDLAKLQANYGPASNPDNTDRIDRFFGHEFTHVLHKAWFRSRDVTATTPLDHALWECLAEGLGNYRSLSSRWVDAEGHLTSRAESTLERLQPILVDRLIALYTASDDEAEALRQGLSMGPFTQKWGALPVALWLAEETGGDDSKLIPWVEAGAPGILDLAHRHLPPHLSTKLRRALPPN